MLPRKISSLQEDMQRLGLTRLVDKDINGKQPATKRQPVSESKQRSSPKSAKQIAEAKATIAARKKRAGKIRESRMAKKLAVFETRLQRIERKAKEAGRKVESRIRMIKGLQKRASVMESYDVRRELGGKDPTRKDLAESFMKVAGLAGTLGRAFGVLENFFGEEEASLGIPVMHPGSAYGYDTNVSNAADSDASGTVTDYGSEKEDDEVDHKDDDLEEDDDPTDSDTDKKDDDLDLGEDDEKAMDGDEVKEDDDEMDKKDDDDMQTEDDLDGDGDDDDDDKDVKEDDEEHDDDEPKAEDEEDPADAKADADKKVEAKRRRAKRAESLARRLPMDYELHTIRIEAEEMATAVGGTGENVNLGYASELMNDMVSYLGGAMKLYFKLQQSMKNMGYVGQDQPVGAGAAPTPTAQPNDSYIGKADPAGETAVDQGGAANAPKTGDATDTSGIKEPKAEGKQVKKK